MTKWTTDQIKNQFLVITEPRSGTQMLERALAAHPDVIMRTWTTSQDNHQPVIDLYAFREMNRREGRRPFRGTITHSWGERFIRQAFGMGLGRHWQVVGYFFPKVVLLTRMNQLHRYLSYQISDILGHWGVYDCRPENPVIDFDFDHFLAFLHDATSCWTAVIKSFPQALRLTYEGLAYRWEESWIGLLNFLGIPQAPIWPSTYRQEFRPIRNIIGNWGPDLEQKFKCYGLEAWLV
jgi:hypothetical protein